MAEIRLRYAASSRLLTDYDCLTFTYLAIIKGFLSTKDEQNMVALTKDVLEHGRGRTLLLLVRETQRKNTMIEKDYPVR